MKKLIIAIIFTFALGFFASSNINKNQNSKKPIRLSDIPSFEEIGIPEKNKKPNPVLDESPTMLSPEDVIRLLEMRAAPSQLTNSQERVYYFPEPGQPSSYDMYMDWNLRQQEQLRLQRQRRQAEIDRINFMNYMSSIQSDLSSINLQLQNEVLNQSFHNYYNWSNEYRNQLNNQTKQMWQEHYDRLNNFRR